MTSTDSDADMTSSKYNVQIGEGQGTVIGDNPHVVQHFYSTPPEPQVDLAVAEATYRQKVVDAYKWLDFGGFARSDLTLAHVPLEDVFVRLSLTMEKVIREPVSSEEASGAQRHESRQRERVITKQEPIELGQALGNHALIVGEPGAGKSTLLRWLAVAFAEARQREPNRVGPAADADRLPVLIEMRRLHDRYLKPEGGETPTWRQYLPEYLTAQDAFANTPPQLLTQALDEGRCLLLFDGLDEVADRQARTRLVRSLVELARLFPGNRVIIGSRPAGVSESEGMLRPQFQHCQIQRFAPEDVQRFFRFWYALDRDLTPEQQRDAADEFYARVQTAPATLELASTPLLSTILLLIWRNEGDLPKRRVDLYERCCQVLIEHWERDHAVAHQGIFAKLGVNWESHLRVLAPLAYDIHKQKQPSASRTDLIKLLIKILQVEGLCASEAQAKLEAEQFLETIGLRSGLLQFMGDDKYGFPHQTFQEYLTARYIAEQSDPKYIDLVMEHLHEAWWQEVHLLTISHLGSRNEEANKASALILTILHAYAPPSWILRSSNYFLLRLIGAGKFLPQVQLERRIAWMLAREFELAARGYAECVPDGTTARVGTELSAQAASLVRHIIHDEDRFNEGQEILLPVVYQLLQRLGNEEVVSALLEALHDTDRGVRERAAQSLGQVGAGNEEVVSALLEALHDTDRGVRRLAAQSLGQVGAGNEEVVSALLEALHDADRDVQWGAAQSLGQVGAGNEEVVSALLEALHDADSIVRWSAAQSLGRLEIKDTTQLRQVLVAFNRCLHDWDNYVRGDALGSIRHLLDGRPIPGYRWVPLRRQ
jgi:hypothetical protein